MDNTQVYVAVWVATFSRIKAGSDHYNKSTLLKIPAEICSMVRNSLSPILWYYKYETQRLTG